MSNNKPSFKQEESNKRRKYMKHSPLQDFGKSGSLNRDMPALVDICHGEDNECIVEKQLQMVGIHYTDKWEGGNDMPKLVRIGADGDTTWEEKAHKKSICAPTHSWELCSQSWDGTSSTQRIGWIPSMETNIDECVGEETQFCTGSWCEETTTEKWQWNRMYSISLWSCSQEREIVQRRTKTVDVVCSEPPVLIEPGVVMVDIGGAINIIGETWDVRYGERLVFGCKVGGTYFFSSASVYATTEMTYIREGEQTIKKKKYDYAVRRIDWGRDCVAAMVKHPPNMCKYYVHLVQPDGTIGSTTTMDNVLPSGSFIPSNIGNCLGVGVWYNEDFYGDGDAYTEGKKRYGKGFLTAMYVLRGKGDELLVVKRMYVVGKDIVDGIGRIGYVFVKTMNIYNKSPKGIFAASIPLYPPEQVLPMNLDWIFVGTGDVIGMVHVFWDTVAVFVDERKSVYDNNTKEKTVVWISMQENGALVTTRSNGFKGTVVGISRKQHLVGIIEATETKLCNCVYGTTVGNTPNGNVMPYQTMLL
jgi:hypothetical protein